MDTEENNSRHGNLNSPFRKKELMVELNFDLMKTIQSFKYDNINERREQKEINEALLRNLKGVNPHRQATQSTKKYKENYHHKRITSSPN